MKNSQDPEIAAKYGLRSGIGLAAPQINVSKRMIGVHVTDEKASYTAMHYLTLRSLATQLKKTYLTGGEGCLSVDQDIPGFVPRYARITVKGTTLEGEEVKIRLKGLPAVVFQHEIDHLDGIMFYDYINKEHPFQEPENAFPYER